MVNDRFIKLLTKELCDDITDVEREELYALLQANKEYRDQKEILTHYWEKDRAEYEANAAMYKKVLDKIRMEEAFAGPEGRIGRARIVWSSAAAVILLAIGVFAWHLNKTPGVEIPVVTVQWLQKTTLPTKKSVVSLSDGTVVTLNSATTLKYPDHFGDSTREIYLDGEAYFDVARDPSHPFIIHANKMNVRVLGTSFNIKSYQNESLSEAALIKGSIEVTLNDRPSDRIILKPKEKLIVQNSTAMIKPTRVLANRASTDDSNSNSNGSSTGKGTRYALTNLTYFPNNAKTIIETSWVENKLVVSDKEFAQFSGQLERWYGVHISFGNDRVKGYRFTALFEKETLPQALNALKMIEHFNYRITDSTVYIY